MKDKNMAVLGIGTAQALGFNAFHTFTLVYILSLNFPCTLELFKKFVSMCGWVGE